jgi:hypothetical protein
VGRGQIELLAALFHPDAPFSGRHFDDVIGRSGQLASA